MFIQYTVSLLASQTVGKDRRRQAFKHWTKGEEREGRLGAEKSIGVEGRQIRLQGLLRGCKEKFLAVCGQFKVRVM